MTFVTTNNCLCINWYGFRCSERDALIVDSQLEKKELKFASSSLTSKTFSAMKRECVPAFVLLTLVPRDFEILGLIGALLQQASFAVRTENGSKYPTPSDTHRVKMCKMAAGRCPQDPWFSMVRTIEAFSHVCSRYRKPLRHDGITHLSYRHYWHAFLRRENSSFLDKGLIFTIVKMTFIL